MACEVTSSGSKEAESFGRTPPDLGAQIRGGRESHNQDRLPMAVSGGTTSLAWLEEEVPPRWSRASLMSPKATSENMSRRARDDNAVRRELEMLEEKMMRQVLRLQEQSERFMDIMMHPLEAKVAALEGRQPVIDCSIAELRGNLKGIQDSMEMQVRRSDQTETRMCKWRKTLEEELQSRMGEVNHRLGEGPAPSDTVSRSEMVELAKVLKKELKKLVEESFQDGQVVSRQELASLGKALREEMAAMEKLTAETAAAKLQGHQELMNAAEAVRAEMKTLTEKAIQEEALVRASMSAVQDLEKASDRSKSALEAADRRLARCEYDLKELKKASQVGTAASPVTEVQEQHPDIEDLLQRMARCEQLEEALQSDLQSQQGLLETLQENQKTAQVQQHTIESMNLKVDGVSDLTKQIMRCEEQLEDLQTQLLQVQLPSSSTVREHDEVLVGPEVLQRLEQCEQLHKEFQKELQLQKSSANLEASQQSMSQQIQNCEKQLEASQQSMSQQIQNCEKQLVAIREELRHELHKSSEVAAVPPAENENEDKDLTDQQLMLLDLQHRVLSLEGVGPGGEESLEVGRTPMGRTPKTPQAVLGQAAELIQKIELDLQQARKAVVPGPDSDVSGPPMLPTPKRKESAEMASPFQLPSLPPVAAMKVSASPRLQRLSMTPRLQEISSERIEAAANRVVAFAAGHEDATLESSSELRAEVAAVWDAIAELAEIVGDAAPQGAVRYTESSSLGALQQTVKSAMEKAETCERTISSVGKQVQGVEVSLQELDSRMYGCERQLRVQEGNKDKEEVFATFDINSFKESAPSRVARAFGRVSDASSTATVSERGGANS